MKKITFLLLFGALLLTTSSVYAGRIGVSGKNTYGQFGIGTTGTTFDVTTITTMGTDNDWQEIASGVYHNLALKFNGTLWAWGRNNGGQLGDGTTTDKLVPTQIGTDTHWKQFDGGLAFTAAIKTDGTLWTWGDNASGQLGNGTTTGSTTPIQIGTDTDWLQVDCGDAYVIALKTDGTLWAWGNNASNQLGDGTTTNKSVPTQIGTANNWAKIAAGKTFNLAIKTDGTLWQWGKYNSSPYTASLLNAPTPTQYGTQTTYTQISVGQNMLDPNTNVDNGAIAVYTTINNPQINNWGYYYYATVRRMLSYSPMPYKYNMEFPYLGELNQIACYLTQGTTSSTYKFYSFVTTVDGIVCAYDRVGGATTGFKGVQMTTDVPWSKILVGGESVLVLERSVGSVNFGALPDKTVGDADFTLLAVSPPSASPVVFTSSDETVAKCTGLNGATVQIIGAGTCTITATMDTNACYTGDVATQTLTVNQVNSKTTPVITWSNPTDITYGTALSATQLNATADIPGEFVYIPAAETVLNVGNNQELTVAFTPTDTENYETVSDTVYINVKKVIPVITWSNPTDITYGTALSATQLNASANVDGAFVYTPALDAVLNAGTHDLALEFTPTDVVSYDVAKDTVTLIVNKTALTITAKDTSRVYGVANPEFKVTYADFVNNEDESVLTTPATVSTPATATSNAGTYDITASNATADNYDISYLKGTLTINKAMPAITWSNPADMTYGTPLSATQLNATTIGDIPGEFLYNPAIGTVLNVSDNQELTVIFTATNAENYEIAKDTVYLNVKSNVVDVMNQEADVTSFSIYPNPVSHQFHINGLKGNAEITLIDIAGKEYLKKTITDEEFVSIENIPAGVYVLLIQNKENSVNFKLIKQ